MRYNPLHLIALEGFLKIFIYINQLSHGICRGRIKGFEGLEVLRCDCLKPFNPSNPLILVDGLGYGSLKNEE